MDGPRSDLTRCRAVAALAALALGATIGAVPAHPPLQTVAHVKVTETPQGPRVDVSVRHDALAFALNDTSFRIGDPPMLQLLNGPEADLAAAFQDGRERFEVGLVVMADGVRVASILTAWPTAQLAYEWRSSRAASLLPCELDFNATLVLPADTKSLTMRFPEVLGTVVMSVDRPGAESLTLPLPLDPGETSPAFAIHAREGGETQDASSALSAAWRFVLLGFTHILPQGSDHCLFVLGLFLLTPRVKPVLWQITAFTVAHTVTLTLSSLHIFTLSSALVEPLIAASIVFIGVENLLSRKVTPWRIAVAFLFGLVHGLGVATAFNEAGFPPGQLVTSLAAFTVGVEVGHIVVLLAAFLLLSWTSRKPWYRTRVMIPLSLMISVVASVWLVQRVFG